MKTHTHSTSRIALAPWVWWSAALLAALVALATIGLMMRNNRGNVIPQARLPQEQRVPAARELSMDEVMLSGQYPFGASGFDSLLPHKPAATSADLATSGHYPFGASGFDSLLPAKR
jgi:hypothetical protein